jgi:hypothetical protein
MENSGQLIDMKNPKIMLAVRNRAKLELLRACLVTSLTLKMELFDALFGWGFS